MWLFHLWNAIHQGVVTFSKCPKWLIQGKVIYVTFSITPSMQIMLSIYLNSSTCIYLSLDNGVTMTSKRRENKNLVSFMFFFPSYKFFQTTAYKVNSRIKTPIWIYVHTVSLLFSCSNLLQRKEQLTTVAIPVIPE